MTLYGPPRELWAKPPGTAAAAALAWGLGGWFVYALSGLFPGPVALALGGLTGLVVFLRNQWRWRANRHAPHAWGLFADGLFLIGHDWARLIPFEDITHLKCLRPQGSHKAFAAAGILAWPLMAVELKSGEVFAVPANLHNREAFQHALSLATFALRYPPYAQTLNRDQQVSLGGITLTPAGVLKNVSPDHPAVPWRGMHLLTAGQRWIRYRPLQGVANPILCAVEDVDDIDVFFSLALSLCARERRLS